MKFRHLITIFAVGALIFVGCTQTQDGATEEAEENFDTRIYGSWSRTNTYADGVHMGSNPAITIFNEDGTYLSTGTCTINGGYMVVDDVLTWTVDSHDCKASGPTSFTSTFNVSEDGEGLTINTSVGGSVVMETFVRATD